LENKLKGIDMKNKIIWLTGNTGAGKTTLANALKEKLYNYVVLDGDEMRDSISLGAGFSKEAREEHNLRVARLAKVLQQQGHNVIVSVIAPFQSTRNKISDIIDCDWVYVKGGKVGEQYPYEAPSSETITVDGSLKTMTIEEEMKAVVEGLRLFNVFIFSLPRSGSSMTTKVCELLGVNMIYTSEDTDKREKMNERYKKNLGDYHPNEAGFFEITENLTSNYLKIISQPYSGCKMIIPVGRHRLDIAKIGYSKVLQMWRDPEEIRQSQQAFYRGNAVEDSETRRAFLRTALVTSKLQLEKIPTIDYHEVHYRKVLDNPKEEVQKIADFIKAPNPIDKAVASVNPGVNRFKKEELEIGI
jgi:adenylylsulfate kinase-like enzyme